MNDAAGNVTGPYTIALGASFVTLQNSQSRSGTFAGSYSGNPDGTGSLNIKTNTGTTITFATVTTDGGKGLLRVPRTTGFPVRIFGSRRSAHSKA